jgi:hypothetical protein
MGESGMEVKLLVSLIQGSRPSPPVPSRPWLMTGLCHSDLLRSSQDAVSASGCLAQKCLPLEAGVLEQLTAVWIAFASGTSGVQSTDDDDGDGDEDDLRGWLRELVLTRAQQDSLCELAREAPTRVQLQRVFR